jgi:hypothetical protein
MNNKEVAQRLVDFVDNYAGRAVPSDLAALYYAVRLGAGLTDPQAQYVTRKLNQYPPSRH